jgi:hypothetical protein
MGIVYGLLGKPIGSVNAQGYLASTHKPRGPHKPRTWTLHRVMWEACEGPIPEGMEINHLNGVKTDIRRVNLECCTSGRNKAHAYEIGLVPRTSPNKVVGRAGSEHYAYKMTPEMRAAIVRRADRGESQRSIAAALGLSQKSVWRALHQAARR